MRFHSPFLVGHYFSITEKSLILKLNLVFDFSVYRSSVVTFDQC